MECSLVLSGLALASSQVMLLPNRPGYSLVRGEKTRHCIRNLELSGRSTGETYLQDSLPSFSKLTLVTRERIVALRLFVFS